MNVVGRFGVLAALAFAGVVVAHHWIRPDISFLENYVSEYAIGPWGAAFSASSFVHGALSLFRATGMSPGIAERIALAAFVSWETVAALRLARYRSHPSPAHLT